MLNCRRGGGIQSAGHFSVPLNHGIEGPLLLINQATRSIIQAFHFDRELQEVPESCSIKVPGCPEWVPHLDRAREGSYQVVIALTATTFLVWPQSHRVLVGRAPSSKSFHKLTAADMSKLEQAGSKKKAVPAQPGDVLVMLGGITVHSSPAVLEGESERIATYAHWEEAK